jgi:Flp pilus assembly pilin Flp
MLRAVLQFLFREELGQDLADYCLLTALIALVAVGVLIEMSGGVQNIWTVASCSLASSNQVANTGTSTAGAGASSAR